MLKRAGIKPIGISKGVPKYFFDFVIQELAPRWDMLQMTEHDYRKEYAKILADQNAFKIIKKIQDISYGKDAALLCYEKPGEFCHRQLVAAWLQKETGFEIIEFKVAEKIDNPGVQQSLF